MLVRWYWNGVFGELYGSTVETRVARDFMEVPAWRRQWHPTQRFRRVEGGIEMTMDVRGTTELVSWVLGFGNKASIVEPIALRNAVDQERAGPVVERLAALE
jgi:predicted DNA-binding transcriptional regulator YafY